MELTSNAGAAAVSAPIAPTMVLVPTYIEAENICRLIDELLRHLPAAHIVVMDDQSPDGTAELVRRTYRHLPTVSGVTRHGARGYGAAMREGMQRFLDSGTERLITIDADLSHDPALTSRMLAALRPGGVAIGSRYVGGVRPATLTTARSLASVMGNRYVRLITGLPVADCTSGFRCYTRSAVARLDLASIRSTGYAFLVETLYRLWRAACPIVEVPIVYRARLFGKSKLGPRIIVESLALPWRLTLRGRRRGRWSRVAPSSD